MAQGFTKALQRFLLAHKGCTLSVNKGFTLIEIAVVLAIIGIISAVSLSLLWNTESADAALVRSVQEQLYSGASQAAMLTGDLPNDDGNLVTLATFITTHLDANANATLNCGAGGGACTLTFNGNTAGYVVSLNGSVTLTGLTGFSRYTVVGGEIVAS